MSVLDRLYAWLTNIRTHRGWGWALLAAGLAGVDAAIVIWLMN